MIYSSAAIHQCPSCSRRDCLWYGTFTKPMSCDYCRAKKGIPFPKPPEELALRLCKELLEKRKNIGKVTA